MTQNILFYIQSVVTHIINVWRQSMYANKYIWRYHFYICWSDKDTSFVIRLDLLDLLITLIDDEYLLAHSVTCPLLQNVGHSRFIGYHFKKRHDGNIDYIYGVVFHHSIKMWYQMSRSMFIIYLVNKRGLVK